MAAAVAEGLDRAIKTRRANSAGIPVGVAQSAMKFIHLALDAAESKIPKRPAASISSYLIATDAVRASRPAQKVDPASLAGRLKKYDKLIVLLTAKQARLGREEVSTAKEMRDFFISLKREGEAEAYQTVVESGLPRVGFRSW
jgi:hypothetical protein